MNLYDDIMNLSERTEKWCDEKAQALANKLNAHYNTTEWKPRVWFNTWWCYDVHCGSISVHEDTISDKIKYTCYVNSELGKTGGTPYEVFIESEPHVAVNNALLFVNDYINSHLTTYIDNLERLKII